MFVRDTAADVMKVAIGVVSCCRWSMPGRTCAQRELYKGEVAVLMLFATAGMMLLVSAGSLVMVYLGLEMLALCSYALVAIDRDSPSPRKRRSSTSCWARWPRACCCTACR
jgi:NADH-quinone oxidoreductase subunit N